MTTNTNAQTTLADKLANLKKLSETGAQTISPVKEAEQLPTHIAQATKQPEKLYHVFYHTIKSCRMVTEFGRSICFVDGKYITDVKEEIDYLQKEMTVGNLHLSIKPGEEQLTSDQLDPMKVLKAKFIAEYKAEQATLAKDIAEGNLPESESDNQKLVPGSTADVSDMAAGSDSGSTSVIS